ncbi:hypothetical protein ACFPN7_32935 [Amycolatopsis halotolerans]|uniref:hypothetical protein n=1 Tax=Amycolatopsis halotolerans TaxID=330083 RepID=UPI00361D2D9D
MPVVSKVGLGIPGRRLAHLDEYQEIRRPELAVPGQVHRVTAKLEPVTFPARSRR